MAPWFKGRGEPGNAEPKSGFFGSVFGRGKKPEAQAVAGNGDLGEDGLEVNDVNSGESAPAPKSRAQSGPKKNRKKDRERRRIEAGKIPDPRKALITPEPPIQPPRVIREVPRPAAESAPVMQEKLEADEEVQYGEPASSAELPPEELERLRDNAATKIVDVAVDQVVNGEAPPEIRQVVLDPEVRAGMAEVVKKKSFLGRASVDFLLGAGGAVTFKVLGGIGLRQALQGALVLNAPGMGALVGAVTGAAYEFGKTYIEESRRLREKQEELEGKLRDLEGINRLEGAVKLKALKENKELAATPLGAELLQEYQGNKRNWGKITWNTLRGGAIGGVGGAVAGWLIESASHLAHSDVVHAATDKVKELGQHLTGGQVQEVIKETIAVQRPPIVETINESFWNTAKEYLQAHQVPAENIDHDLINKAMRVLAEHSGVEITGDHLGEAVAAGHEHVAGGIADTALPTDFEVRGFENLNSLIVEAGGSPEQLIEWVKIEPPAGLPDYPVWSDSHVQEGQWGQNEWVNLGIAAEVAVGTGAAYLVRRDFKKRKKQKQEAESAISTSAIGGAGLSLEEPAVQPQISEPGSAVVNLETAPALGANLPEAAPIVAPVPAKPKRRFGIFGRGDSQHPAKPAGVLNIGEPPASGAEFDFGPANPEYSNLVIEADNIARALNNVDELLAQGRTADAAQACIDAETLFYNARWVPAGLTSKQREFVDQKHDECQRALDQRKAHVRRAENDLERTRRINPPPAEYEPERGVNVTNEVTESEMPGFLPQRPQVPVSAFELHGANEQNRAPYTEPVFEPSPQKFITMPEMPVINLGNFPVGQERPVAPVPSAGGMPEGDPDSIQQYNTDVYDDYDDKDDAGSADIQPGTAEKPEAPRLTADQVNKKKLLTESGGEGIISKIKGLSVESKENIRSTIEKINWADKADVKRHMKALEGIIALLAETAQPSAKYAADEIAALYPDMLRNKVNHAFDKPDAKGKNKKKKKK